VSTRTRRRSFVGRAPAVQTAARAANLPARLWPYELRHSRITRWVAQGHNLALVQNAAGHASTRTTMLYVHLVDDDLSVLVTPPAARRRRSMGAHSRTNGLERGRPASQRVSGRRCLGGLGRLVSGVRGGKSVENGGPNCCPNARRESRKSLWERWPSG